MKQIKKILGIALFACTLSVADTAVSEAKSVTGVNDVKQVSVRIGSQPRHGYYYRRRMERERFRRRMAWRRHHRMMMHRRGY